MSIIKSILDNDLYKFTVSNGYFTCYPYSSGVFTFKDRNRMDFPEGFKEELLRQIDLMAEIRLTEDELEYMKSLKFFPPTYLEFLKGFRYDPKEVRLDVVDGKLEIDCTGYRKSPIRSDTPFFKKCYFSTIKTTKMKDNMLENVIYNTFINKKGCRF